MKTHKRHNSAKKGLVIGMLIVFAILAVLLYFYHNKWKYLYIVDNVPTSLTGLGIIVAISLTICALLVLGGVFLGVCFPQKSESKKTNKKSQK